MENKVTDLIYCILDDEFEIYRDTHVSSEPYSNTIRMEHNDEEFLITVTRVEK